MKKITDFLFSMPFMGFLILFMAIASATATFIENDFGPEGARALVYNTRWFELLLVLIMVNLVGNIFINKTYKKKKFTIFLFHFAFVLIFLGAAVTRYISYEGSMHIREGASSNYILSSGSYIYGTAVKDGESVTFYKKANISSARKSHFQKKIKVGNETFTLKLEKFIPNAQKSLIPDPEGGPVVSLVAVGRTGRIDVPLEKGDKMEANGEIIGFENIKNEDSLYLYQAKKNLYFLSVSDVYKMNMQGGLQDTLIASTPHLFEKNSIYLAGNTQIVLKDFTNKGKITWVSGSKNQGQISNVLVMHLENRKQIKEFSISGRPDLQGNNTRVELGGVKFAFYFGPRSISLPFSLGLQDFQLERYPGSNSPASYASEVILKDTEKNVNMPFRIYMNHILNYRGFKFFQSSYDNDEKGTILSVNHDSLGTTLTYIGYFLMTLGMVLSIFNKNSHFMALGRSINLSSSGKKAKTLAILVGLGFFLSTGFSTHAQSPLDTMKVGVIPKNISNEFSSVLVQDQGGRIKPFQTMASEVLRKVSRKDNLSGLNPVQVVLGMYYYPASWQKVPMIKITNDQIKKILGTSASRVSFLDFFDINRNNTYKLGRYVQDAYQKKPAARDKFDQTIIKIDERLNVSYLVYTGNFFRIFPAKGDPDQKWYTPTDASQHVPDKDSLFVAGVLHSFYSSLEEQSQGNALEIIKGIKKYQNLNAPDLIPSNFKIALEILTNKSDIFNKLSMFYGLVGFILLFVLFIGILFVKMQYDKWIRVFSWLLILGFAFQTLGLLARWYISGHAPWSNGYESMIYISWATMLAGLIFARKTPFTLPAAAILSSLTLFVAHLSWMNPEITNLVPVLNSYWLTIHVSVITASYGFLGMGMVLGLLNLILYIAKNSKNKLRIDEQIRTLSKINEMTLILGVYFISIGTFLGGVWANESWGRYWGWDPKETWALITGLVYIFVVHMRYIPGLRGHFAFNLASVLSFFSVMMTYFGVNYYLSGLHSYAQGDPVPIPSFVYYTLGALFILFISAWLKEKKYIKTQEPE